MADSVGGGFAQGLAGGMALSAQGRATANQEAFQQAQLGLQRDQIASQERREQIKLIRDEYTAIKTAIAENAKAVGPEAAAKVLASPNMQAVLAGLSQRFTGAGVNIAPEQLVAELQGAASLAPDPMAVGQVNAQNDALKARATGAVETEVAVDRAQRLAPVETAAAVAQARALVPVEVEKAGAVARAQENAKGFIPTSPEGKQVYDRNNLVKVFGADSEDVKRFDRLAEAAEKPALSEKDIAGLRADFTKAVKDPIDALTAYQRLKTSNSPDGASDIALIFSFMKMLDPASTVREGEFATLQNAGSIPERIVAQYNAAREGTFLTPALRQQYLAQADKLAEPMRVILKASIDEYTAIAKRKNADPRDIVTGVDSFIARTPKPGQPVDTGGGDKVLLDELGGK